MRRISLSHNSLEEDFEDHQSKRVRLEIPDWLMKLPGCSCFVNRCGITEFRRRLFHMSPALLLLGIPIFPHDDPWYPTVFKTMVILVSITTISMAVYYGPLLTRPGEKHWMHAVLGYMIPVVIPLLLLPHRTELGLMTLQIVALGDGSATVGGLMFGGQPLPWNRKKTISGLVCFTVVGSIAATYSYWGEVQASIGTDFLVCSIAALCAGFVESLPIRSNDNLRVGITAFVVGFAMSQWTL